MSGQKKKRAPAKAQKKPKPKKAVAKRRVDNEVVAEVAEQKAAVETARLLAKWKRVTTLLRPRRGRPLPKPVWKPVLYLRGLGVWSRNERERPVRRKLSTLLAAAGVTWMKLVKVSGSAIKMNIFAFLQLQTMADAEIAWNLLDGMSLRGGQDVYVEWARTFMLDDSEDYETTPRNWDSYVTELLGATAALSLQEDIEMENGDIGEAAEVDDMEIDDSPDDGIEIDEDALDGPSTSTSSSAPIDVDLDVRTEERVQTACAPLSNMPVEFPSIAPIVVDPFVTVHAPVTASEPSGPMPVEFSPAALHVHAEPKPTAPRRPAPPTISVGPNDHSWPHAVPLAAPPAISPALSTSATPPATEEAPMSVGESVVVAPSSAVADDLVEDVSPPIALPAADGAVSVHVPALDLGYIDEAAQEHVAQADPANGSVFYNLPAEDLDELPQLIWSLNNPDETPTFVQPADLMLVAPTPAAPAPVDLGPIVQSPVLVQPVVAPTSATVPAAPARHDSTFSPPVAHSTTPVAAAPSGPARAIAPLRARPVPSPGGLPPGGPPPRSNAPPRPPGASTSRGGASPFHARDPKKKASAQAYLSRNKPAEAQPRASLPLPAPYLPPPPVSLATEEEAGINGH